MEIKDLQNRVNSLKTNIEQFKKDMSDFAHSKNIYFLNPYCNAGSKIANCSLHCHTTNSDGTLSPESLLSKYKSFGYDYVNISDHWHMTEAKLNGLITTIGCESSRTGRTEHWVMIDIPKQSEVTEDEWQEIVNISNGGDLLANYAKQCRKLGIMSALAHPRWLCDDYLKATYDFFEVLNYGGVEKGNHEWMLEKVLNNGNRCFLIGTEDEHGTPSFASYKGYTRVLYNGNKTKDNILKGLKNGQCYPTIGKDAPIMNISIQGNIITVSTNIDADIEIIYGYNTVLSSTRGKKLTFEIPNERNYVRVKAYKSKKTSALQNVCFSQVFWRI